ncbi:lasso peptide biosynthesis B2 protein [Erythrobacter sp. SDW2]|uniref:lasso peptide biosynthesis B2 protein n=1 Tax=Erythrobacter sp. SDW2 TaxID=2907154 RepID=UPI001F21986C|nr:lasso peptide biosynthesis B2 protein [Erythrobacter sp. SDW2]UIP06155.1 lasso peptide biosynthesis B2 protein [Erythrobacter sp. SDW2]
MSALLPTLRRKLAGLRGYSASEITMVAPSLVLLGLARLAILFLPFRFYARVLGTVASQGLPAPPLTAGLDNRARSIGRSVRATARITPWKSVCLPQAMVASLLLRVGGVPHVVHFGLAPGDAKPDAAPMQAHAWIVAGKRIVTGAPVLPEYRIVSSFASPPPAT